MKKYILIFLCSSVLFGCSTYHDSGYSGNNEQTYQDHGHGLKN